MEKATYTTIDQYIAMFPAEIQAKLQAMRETIRAAAPDAGERISYMIPTFTLHGNLVHFAAMKRHIGFYPASSGVEAFRDELAPYSLSRGTVRFPIDQPLPLDLVTRIVRFRVSENTNRAAAKARKSKAPANA